MTLIMVRGANALSGSIAVQGAKNSALPILAATLLNRGETVLRRGNRRENAQRLLRRNARQGRDFFLGGFRRRMDKG